jgi:molecular chaperone DnaK (HSP70)
MPPVVDEKRYIVGIDLGTTNSAMCYIDLWKGSGSGRGIEIFPIPQLTGPAEVSTLRILPSFLYLAGEHEIPKEALALPWAHEGESFVGFFAREQGARVPKRLVFSAKSWLCHSRVDRKAPILPWGADDQIPRVSPVEATSLYLRHMRQAWNHAREGDEELFLENQTVIITVPASFDEIARDLTVEAAIMAGLKNITLLEEPLAAFYHWLFLHEGEWQDIVKPGELIVVCDVGGGTTDFTLITLKESERNPVFDRIAVGDHLILGGDNMDLTLARHAETWMYGTGKSPLKIHRWQALCHQCREVKENILSGLEESRVITMVGEGGRLIADTVRTTLTRRQVEEIILDGFFPVFDPGDVGLDQARQGITEFGLPYAQDPAITRHLIRFLRQHREDVFRVLGKETPKPDLILFNGGVLKPVSIQERIRDCIRHAFDERDAALPRPMGSTDLDLAVALGAAYYGLVRTGHGIRVGSGSARAYYLGVGHSEVKGARADSQKMAVCLVERGMEEGSKVELKGKEMHVLANQPVSFDLYSSSFRVGDQVGDVVPVDDSLTPLPPIQTVIQFGKKAGQTTLPVRVEADYTELGTLALWCKALKSPHRWRLHFQLRALERSMPVRDHDVFEESLLERILNEVEESFSDKSRHPGTGEIVKTIGHILQRRKEEWPSALIRRMADRLTMLSPARQKSPELESRWLNLIGFCLRPGFGDALDEHRVQQLWKIYQDGPRHPNKAQVRCEWWVLWRRVAGGLSAKQQQKFCRDISSLLSPRKGAVKKKLPEQEHMEMWMTLASMERLAVEEKIGWGRFLLGQLSPKKGGPQYWWALSRIGAREPLYGPIEKVVPREEAARWVQAILSISWKNTRPVGMAMIQICRLTGDRRRDMDPSIRQRVYDWLGLFEWAQSSSRILREVVPLAPQEASLIFGESLPPGILLHEE